MKRNIWVKILQPLYPLSSYVHYISFTGPSRPFDYADAKGQLLEILQYITPWNKFFISSEIVLNMVFLSKTRHHITTVIKNLVLKDKFFQKKVFRWEFPLSASSPCWFSCLLSKIYVHSQKLSTSLCLYMQPKKFKVH